MNTEHIIDVQSSSCSLSSGKFHKLPTIFLLACLLIIGACRNTGPGMSDQSVSAETTDAKEIANVEHEDETDPSEPAVPDEPQMPDSSLFDGKTLKNWKITEKPAAITRG